MWSLKLLTGVQISPDAVREVVDYHDSAAAKKLTSTLYNISKPGSNVVVKGRSGRDLFEATKKKATESKAAEADQLTAGLAGIGRPARLPENSDPLDEQLHEAKSDRSFDTYAQSFFSDSRGGHGTVMQQAGDSLRSAKPGTPEHRRLTAMKWVAENTPAKSTPKQYLRDLRIYGGYNGGKQQEQFKEYERNIDIMRGSAARDFDSLDGE